jgi:predicted transcriptional regulator
MRWLMAVDEAATVAILGGAVTAVIRRRRPAALRVGDEIYLYASTLERVVGRFEVAGVELDSGAGIARRYHRQAGATLTAALGQLRTCRASAAVLVGTGSQMEPMALPTGLPHPEDGLLPIVDPEIERLLDRAEKAMHA